MATNPKIIVEQLPTGGPDWAERRLFNQRGEMAQILNRADEPFKHLVYWDLDTPASGEERGHHYHKQTIETFYILTGQAEIIWEDLDSGETGVTRVKAGTRVIIKPRLAHAYRTTNYSQVLEYSPEPYDPTDTYPHRVVV